LVLCGLSSMESPRQAHLLTRRRQETAEGTCCKAPAVRVRRRRREEILQEFSISRPGRSPSRAGSGMKTQRRGTTPPNNRVRAVTNSLRVESHFTIKSLDRFHQYSVQLSSHEEQLFLTEKLHRVSLGGHTVGEGGLAGQPRRLSAWRWPMHEIGLALPHLHSSCPASGPALRSGDPGAGFKQFHEYCEMVSFALCRRSLTERRRGHRSLAFTVRETALVPF
jgi:hypothetical protein